MMLTSRSAVCLDKFEVCLDKFSEKDIRYVFENYNLWSLNICNWSFRLHCMLENSILELT